VLLSRGVSALSVLVRQLRSYPLLLLLFAAVVSAVVGDRTEAFIIVGIMAMSVGLSFFNEYRSEKAVEALHSQIRHVAFVDRDGRGKLVRPARVRPPRRAGSNRGGIQPPTDASWSCQVRAHPVEQNGSPFLTAISGRPLRQFTQHPSPRRGGSAGGDRRSANFNRASSASFPLCSIAVPVEASTNPDLSGSDVQVLLHGARHNHWNVQSRLRWAGQAVPSELPAPLPRGLVARDLRCSGRGDALPGLGRGRAGVAV
jgi:hypothetical protein